MTATALIFCVSANAVKEYTVAAKSGDLPFHYKTCQSLDYPIGMEVVSNPEHLTLKTLEIEEFYSDGKGYEYPVGHWVVEKIGTRAFMDSQIESASLPSTVNRIYDSAFRNSMLREIKFKPGLAYVGKYAFAGSRLENVALPESVRIISNSAFANIPSLSSISLPSTLGVLGGYTFYGDTQLETITCHAVVPPTASDSDFGIIRTGDSGKETGYFGPDPEKCVIYVPGESVALYRQAEGWKRYKNIFAVETSGADMPAADGLDAKYRVEKGAVSIHGQAGDNVEIYDLGGILLDSRHFGNAGTFRHAGEGVRVLRINGASVKIIL